jgi:hypothetical protein
MDDVLPKIEILEARLAKDGGDPFVWARERVEDTTTGQVEEDARWSLTNQVLKKCIKAGEPVPHHARLVRATLPFDAANALTIMKITRDDPLCPRGFMWVTDEDLDHLKASPSWKPRDWVSKTSDGETTKMTTQLASITSAYTKSVPLVDVDTAAFLREMLKPKQPAWMDEAFGPLPVL